MLAANEISNNDIYVIILAFDLLLGGTCIRIVYMVRQMSGIYLIAPEILGQSKRWCWMYVPLCPW